jgi:hypothetical protein
LLNLKLKARSQKMAGTIEEYNNTIGKSKPTPTQAELNKISQGERVTLEDDGSGPDLNQSPPPPQKKTMEAQSGGGYQTRAATPAPKKPGE